MQYLSTRNDKLRVSAKEAILQGLSEDGGLFVPAEEVKPDKSVRELYGLDYKDTACAVMRCFFTDFTEEELRHCVESAYDEKFDDPVIAPVRAVGDAAYLELFHGKTIAFKDMALSILPHLMTTASASLGSKEEIVILTATSGDTGKAALAGFADVPGTRIIVFYPKDGVSRIQELQMVTEAGKNTLVAGIHGNFDDAQTGVKQIFSDPALRERLKENGFRFSSANSINIGRLIPQVAYYVYAYAQMVKQGLIEEGEQINVTVPTGNFGNILAAYYAKKLGTPIRKLICASNQNKVLFDFFQTGIYDANRAFYLSASPSMDILISSNLERLIYEIGGGEGKNIELMESLKKNGSYAVTPAMREKLKDFAAGFATEEETLNRIKEVYDSAHYVLDPHTAVASAVYEKYRRETGDKTKTLIVSTASPYKFPAAVVKAIDPSVTEEDAFRLTDRLEALSGVPVPQAVTGLRQAAILHDTVCEKDKMREVVLRNLGL